MDEFLKKEQFIQLPKQSLLPINEYPDPVLAERVILDADFKAERLSPEDAIIYYTAIHKMLKNTKPFQF